jgi:hypothetical protein
MRQVSNRLATADGRWAVDVISLPLTGTGRDGAWLRVREFGFFAAEVRRREDLARFPFSLCDLRAALARLAVSRATRRPRRCRVLAAAAHGQARA